MQKTYLGELSFPSTLAECVLPPMIVIIVSLYLHHCDGNAKNKEKTKTKEVVSDATRVTHFANKKG